MKETEREAIQRLLKSSLPRIANAEPARDLWPEMLKRIEAGEDSSFRFGLLDWVIAGLVAVSIFVFPGVIPELFYHL
jgi:ParB-like chromosome segregation protein Spo0J